MLNIMLSPPSITTAEVPLSKALPAAQVDHFSAQDKCNTPTPC